MTSPSFDPLAKRQSAISEECSKEVASTLPSQDLLREEEIAQEEEMVVWECEDEKIEEDDEESDRDEDDGKATNEDEIEEIDPEVDAMCLEQACRSVLRDLNAQLWSASRDFAVPIGILASMVEDFVVYQSHGLPPRPPEFYVEDTRLWPEFTFGRRQRRLLVEKEYLADARKRPGFLSWEIDIEDLA